MFSKLLYGVGASFVIGAAIIAIGLIINNEMLSNIGIAFPIIATGFIFLYISIFNFRNLEKG